MSTAEELREWLDAQNKAFYYRMLCERESMSKYCSKYATYVSNNFEDCGTCTQCIEGGK